MDRFGVKSLVFRCLGGSLLLLSASTVFAQQNMKPFPPEPAPPITGDDAPYFRDTQFGQYPHFGNPGAPSEGHLHRDLPDVHYGVWYRPNSFQGQTDWCKPLPFNPRGRGTPKHTACERLDYAPYQLAVPHTPYGPYYYPRPLTYNCCREEKQDKKNWFKFW